MPTSSPGPGAPYDLASAVSKLRSLDLVSLISTLGNGARPPASTNSTSAQSQQPQAPEWLPGNLDFAGRDPWHPQYAGLTNQPSSEDGLLAFHSESGRTPSDMIQGDDGLYRSNPMAVALKQRRSASEEATRQAQSEEADAMVDELSRQKARKDAAQDQEWAERSAQSAANFEADMQARGAQRTAQRRGGLPGVGRGTRRRIDPR